jgi:site-specific DNA-methyltransferase (adenine-specific)
METNSLNNIDCTTIDNLKLLLSQPDKSVDLIYCDILYGTGKQFADYQDLKPIRSEIETHYIPRIKEMKRVLKSTGSLYLQMDFRIEHWLRIILDDYFITQNSITWCYDRWTNSQKRFIPQSDRILFATKTNDYTFNKTHVSFSEKSKHKGGRFSKVNHGKLDQIYVNEKREKQCGDWWNISSLNSQSKERVKYATQKPKALIERIIKASSNEGDTVADYYLGSGTTAVVCKELNRNFIGCDINANAIEITNARLNAIQKHFDENL